MPCPPWVRDALLACAGAVAYFALFQTAHTFWYLPAGVRFVTLLLLPYRSWPWFLAAQTALFAPHIDDVSIGESIAGHATYGLILFATACVGPWLLRRMQWPARPMTFAAIAQLVAAMALSAIATTPVNRYAYDFFEAAQMSPLRLLLQLLLGDYIGMLAIVPPALMTLRDRPDEATWERWRFDVPFVLLPTLLLYVALDSRATESQVFFICALLAFVPNIYFAVRSGWRGAALSLFGTSAVVEWSGFLSGNAELTINAQGILAVAGSATLLLGAARDTLVGIQKELEFRHGRLAVAYARQDSLTTELRDAARRNLEMAEELRRGITAELHDEIGQNLAALQTRVRLLERKAGAEGAELAAEIASTLARMRHTVSGLLSSLRPAGLDDFGLIHALREGTIRSLVEGAGLTWDMRIADVDNCLVRLNDNTRTALYRIIQEFATNTVRHARATRLCVRLRARGDDTCARIVLALADDGRGFASTQRATGIGLVSIHDRVRVLGGRLRLRSGAFGTRLWVSAVLPNREAIGAT